MKIDSQKTDRETVFAPRRNHDSD